MLEQELIDLKNQLTRIENKIKPSLLTEERIIDLEQKLEEIRSSIKAVVG